MVRTGPIPLNRAIHILKGVASLLETGLRMRQRTSKDPNQVQVATSLDVVGWLLLAALIAGCGQASTASRNEDQSSPTSVATAAVEVSIVDFAFKPAALTVPAGTVVKWTNYGSTAFDGTQMGTGDHDVTFDDPTIPSSPDMPHMATFSVRFNDPGVYRYHSRMIPSMTGTVTVLSGP